MQEYDVDMVQHDLAVGRASFAGVLPDFIKLGSNINPPPASSGIGGKDNIKNYTLISETPWLICIRRDQRHGFIKALQTTEGFQSCTPNKFDYLGVQSMRAISKDDFIRVLRRANIPTIKIYGFGMKSDLGFLARHLHKSAESDTGVARFDIGWNNAQSLFPPTKREWRLAEERRRRARARAGTTVFVTLLKFKGRSSRGKISDRDFNTYFRDNTQLTEPFNFEIFPNLLTNKYGTVLITPSSADQRRLGVLFIRIYQGGLTHTAKGAAGSLLKFSETHRYHATTLNWVTKAHDVAVRVLQTPDRHLSYLRAEFTFAINTVDRTSQGGRATTIVTDSRSAVQMMSNIMEALTNVLEHKSFDIPYYKDRLLLTVRRMHLDFKQRFSNSLTTNREQAMKIIFFNMLGATDATVKVKSRKNSGYPEAHMLKARATRFLYQQRDRRGNTYTTNVSGLVRRERRPNHFWDKEMRMFFRRDSDSDESEDEGDDGDGGGGMGNAQSGAARRRPHQDDGEDDGDDGEYLPPGTRKRGRPSKKEVADRTRHLAGLKPPKDLRKRTARKRKATVPPASEDDDEETEFEEEPPRQPAAPSRAAEAGASVPSLGEALRSGVAARSREAPVFTAEHEEAVRRAYNVQLPPSKARRLARKRTAEQRAAPAPKSAAPSAPPPEPAEQQAEERPAAAGRPSKRRRKPRSGKAEMPLSQQQAVDRESDVDPETRRQRQEAAEKRRREREVRREMMDRLPRTRAEMEAHYGPIFAERGLRFSVDLMEMLRERADVQVYPDNPRGVYVVQRARGGFYVRLGRHPDDEDDMWAHDIYLQLYATLIEDFEDKWTILPDDITKTIKTLHQRSY